MARPLRIEYPGAFYHVINRGLERREIYRSPKDYEYFLGLLAHLHEKYGILIYSYCLMPNHYHLYLQTPTGNLSKAMRQLDGNNGDMTH
jgi:REP element-mobilizing transposase RayT